ncbi:RDD family protein [Pseudarthrobacter sp. AG30]|uniref:RDD family protein n=1 Tax=Pseudarthrobacter sp. AG30 TaxID=2249742 RepID=UPI0034CDB318
MTSDVDRCPRCQQTVRAGATFCAACGAPLPNRAARRNRGQGPGPHDDQAGARDGHAAHAPGIPGTIPVVERPPAAQPAGIAYPGTAPAGTDPGSAGGSTRVGAAPGGGTGMAVNLELVPAAAGKRLGAAVIDWLPGVAVLVVTFAIGFAGITRSRSGGFIVYDTSSLVLFGGIGLGLTLAYLFVVLGLEARTGKTPGNLLMGIRSADQDGYAPGAGGVFLRGVITGAGILLSLVAAVLVVVFKWFDAAMFILGPLLLLGAVWAVLVVVSSQWDKNGGLRAWNDTAAKTLVFDVKAGRDPITTGGIQGPYSFAPLDLPPVQQVLSPVAGARTATTAAARQPTPQPAPGLAAQAPQPPAAQAPLPQSAQPQTALPQAVPLPPAAQAPASQFAPPQAAAPQPPAPQAPAPAAAAPSQTMPYTSPASFAPPSVQDAPYPATAYPAATQNPQPVTPHAAQPAAGSHGFAPGAQASTAGHRVPGPHLDDDVERTQVRSDTGGPAPVAVLRIRLDDGRDFQLDRSVLVGRNPVGQPGEQHAQLLAVDDPGRSISKTHLHLLTDGAGIWVTDRQSTNGSAVTTPDGLRTPLAPGVPTFVTPGSSVHFGDRTFYLGQA